MPSRISSGLALAVLVSSVHCAHAQQDEGTRVALASNVFRPPKVEASQQRMNQLRVPDGFIVSVFASGLLNARILAVGPGNALYVSRREQGDVLLLKDTDGDGRADGQPVVVANRPGAHGIAVHGGKLYLATVKEIFVGELLPDGRVGPLSMLLGDLPDAGQHANRTLAIGPDGMLYISVGSTCNGCNESNPENATLLRASLDGKTRMIFASGLRNTIGFDWHPQTGELWGMDHGIDMLGDAIQPEELNKIEHGKQYGWPHVWGKGDLNPQSVPPPGGMTKEQWKAQSVPMVSGYTAHAAPMQFVFYTGSQFPAEYRNDAFVAMRGSWNRDPASGYELVHIDFQEGKPGSIKPFLTGLLTDAGKAHMGRPVGVAQAADGALLMSDDANGVIYRIAHRGGGNSSGAARPTPAGAMLSQVEQGNDVPLALQREQMRGKSTLQIGSGNFAPGTAIPGKHSEYYDGVSPALQWTQVPGAKSYLILAEDPDAKPIKPYVHWVAWNIPASVTSLPEGLQEQMALTLPEGVLQGRTSRGTVGYLGPRPPVGDPPHHYHFQVFALDTLLSVPPGADRDQVLQAAAGHVLAAGELVGLYQQTAAPLK